MDNQNNVHHRKKCTRLGISLALLGLAIGVAGCGSSTDSSTANGSSPAASGSPAGTASTNKAYSFQPTIARAAGKTYTFTIQNKPAWTTFVPRTGELSGTPTVADIGTYPNIIITVTDGETITVMQPFSITVIGAPASSSSSSGSSSGSSSSTTASGAPAAAIAVGYTTRTYGPAVTLHSNWLDWNFYAAGAQPAGAVSQNADGSLYISGIENNNYGGTVASAVQTSTGNKWSGTAFGGGAYFEVVASIKNQDNGPYNNGGAAFWALDIEHTSQGPYDVSWPNQPKNSAGDPYLDFFEIDFFQYDVNEYAYQNGIGNWYGYNKGTASDNPNDEVPGSAGSVKVPTGTDFSKYHKFGTLWVRATPSTRGYLKFYFDDAQIGATFYWNYNDPNNPNPPPPQDNVSAMSGMDGRHMFLILGTGTDQPMTVQSVSVWQLSGADNLIE